MPTQEQIDAFLELDKRGAFKDKDPQVVEELRARFTSAQPSKEKPIRSIITDKSTGARVDVFPPKPSPRYDTLYPDSPSGVESKDPINLRANRFRYFYPDPKTGKPNFSPAYEAIAETANETLKSNLEMGMFGLSGLSEKATSFIENFSGVPREQKVPFLQDLGASIPAQFVGAKAIGAVATPLINAIAGTPLGKILQKKLFEKTSTEVATQVIDSFAPKEIKDASAKIAARTPKEVVADVVKGATAEAEKDPAFLGISEKGMPTTKVPLAEKLGEKAGAINLDYLNTPENVKKAMQELASKAPEAFKGQRISVDEMMQAAKDVGITKADILNGKLNNIDVLHPRILAGRQIMVKVAEDLNALKQKLLLPTSTHEDLVAFQAAFDRARDISKAVREPISEVARTLRSQQIAVGSQEYREKATQQILKSMEGKKLSEEVARRFASVDTSNPRDVALFMREMQDTSTIDKIYEGYRNFLLSGTLTPVRNAIGNTMAILTRTTERPVSTMIDLIRSGVSRAPRERFFSELPKDAQAQVFGVWEGLKDGRIAFNQELPVFGFDKFSEAARPIAIKGKLGRVIRIPQRLSMAADEPFKAVIYKGELASSAYRMAEKEGLKGPLKTNRIAELIASPTLEMKEAAQKAAEHYTFQDPLGPIGKWISQGRETEGVFGTVLKFIVPFVQVAANIPKFALQRTALYLPAIAKKVATGELKGGALSDELAKVAVGTVASAPLIQLAAEGKVTGNGPINPGERAVWLMSHQPYSVKIGNTWHSYRSIEPIGTLLGTIGDLYENWDRVDVQQAATALGVSVAKNLTNSSYMTGLRDVLDAITDPTRNGEKWLTRVAGSLVPNAISSVTRATEPTILKPKTAGQAIRSRIPLVDKSDIPPVLDIWGNPVVREGTPAARLFWPVTQKEIPLDEATKEVSRLKMSIGSPSNKIENVDLTVKEYLVYTRLSGKIANRIVTTMIKPTNKTYQQLSDEEKANAISSIITKARKSAKNKLLNKEDTFFLPELYKRVNAHKKKPE